MAEGNIEMPIRQSITVTSTSEYFESAEGIVSGDTLYLKVEIKNTAPYDRFFDIPITFTDVGNKRIRMTTIGSVQIGASADVGKTVSAVLSAGKLLTMRLSASFNIKIGLYFVIPYY